MTKLLTSLVLVLTLCAISITQAEARAHQNLSSEFCQERYCGTVQEPTIKRKVIHHTPLRDWYYDGETPITRCAHHGCREVKKHRRHELVAAHGSQEASIQPHSPECPRVASCGCETAKYIFGEARRSLWLAANWFQFPRANPAPGMVAVRQHHVMAIITDHGDGTATVFDPNSGGHLNRIHRRSLAGFSIRNPHGHGYASAG